MGTGLGKLAVLGAGNVGRRHGEFYRGRGWEIAYVDTDQTMVDTVGFEDAMRDADGVLICTPPDQHLQGLLAALPHGKPIFVEKPLATTVMVTQSVLETARERKIPIQVGYVWRWDLRWWDLLAKAQPGHVVFVRACYSQSLSLRTRAQKIPPWMTALPIEWEMSHIVDLVLSLCVEARLIGVSRQSDFVLSLLLPQAFIHMDYLSNDTTGTVEVLTDDGTTHHWTRDGADLSQLYAAELIHFERVVDGRAVPFPSAVDALKTVELLDSLRRDPVPNRIQTAADEGVAMAQ